MCGIDVSPFSKKIELPYFVATFFVKHSPRASYELKNGETFNGHLVNCDNWMNLTLREVIQTSPEGDRFWRLPECYIRGNTIKYLRVPDEIIEMVKEDAIRQRQAASGGNRGRK
ncbi:690_t:CDS:2 [Funneliformis geosporum]|nr:690_t:CDS:2 [Funneliformis geosporum]